MDVFISWSGNRSEKVAEALREWLPNVIQSVAPFMSASDIEKGSRWSNEIAEHLDKAEFGLICLTPENLTTPWLLFEAGALSKSIETSRVVPYLYGLTPTQLEWPLAQFQAAEAKKSPTLEVVESINGALDENKLESGRLERAFETWWPQLEASLGNIPEATEEVPPSRSDQEILEEILSLCRQMPSQIFRQMSRLPHRELLDLDQLDADLVRDRLVGGWRMRPSHPIERTDDEHLRTRYNRIIRQLARDRTLRESELQRETDELFPGSQPSSQGDTQSENNADHGQ